MVAQIVEWPTAMEGVRALQNDRSATGRPGTGTPVLSCRGAMLLSDLCQLPDECGRTLSVTWLPVFTPNSGPLADRAAQNHRLKMSHDSPSRVECRKSSSPSS